MESALQRCRSPLGHTQPLPLSLAPAPSPSAPRSPPLSPPPPSRLLAPSSPFLSTAIVAGCRCRPHQSRRRISASHAARCVPRAVLGPCSPQQQAVDPRLQLPRPPSPPRASEPPCCPLRLATATTRPCLRLVHSWSPPAAHIPRSRLLSNGSTSLRTLCCGILFGAVSASPQSAPGCPLGLSCRLHASLFRFPFTCSLTASPASLQRERSNLISATTGDLLT